MARNYTTTRSKVHTFADGLSSRLYLVKPARRSARHPELHSLEEVAVGE
jgi:hypothetical protein